MPARRTVIVEGPLAYRMRRIAAARLSEVGVQILSLPEAAARLAGGFIRPAQHSDIEPCIRAALAAGGFERIQDIRALPGMTRSVAATLGNLWHADCPLSEGPNESPHLRDLAKIESRLRAQLPTGVLAPPDLRTSALLRVQHTRAVLGDVELDGCVDVAPVWRPMLKAIGKQVGLMWRRNESGAPPDWYKGSVDERNRRAAAEPNVVVCASPRSEVVETLRWVRELIAEKAVLPEEIAVCAPSTLEWDDTMLALAAEAELPLHFSHGIPALASQEGQACASLADILLNGLSQERIRRLFRHALDRGPALAGLPFSWSSGLQPDAALFELDHWRRALEDAHRRRGDGIDVRAQMLYLLEVLAQGPSAANEAGASFLWRSAQALWVEALRRAPAHALEYSLQELRVPDGRDPASNVVWGPAAHLAAAPRPYVRLLGMTARSWPRRAGDDPLLPRDVAPQALSAQPSVTDQDRRAYRIITGAASGACALSRSLRNAQGSLLAPSLLLPRKPARVLRRARLPTHAFDEADRLLARPLEGKAVPHLVSAVECWRDWRRPMITPHDGRVRPDHPALLQAIDGLQSATSLRTMLRDPLGFLWRYALGWRAPVDDSQPLRLDKREFGELVHDILRRAVDALEAGPGFARAASHEVESAVGGAIEAIGQARPLERPTPPAQLWRHTLQIAGELSIKALTHFPPIMGTSKSWTEVPFGDARQSDGRSIPWPPASPVVVPGTSVRVRGKIDRLDFGRAHGPVRRHGNIDNADLDFGRCIGKGCVYTPPSLDLGILSNAERHAHHIALHVLS